VTDICTSCGKPLTPGAKFCAECGAVVVAIPSSPDVTGTIHALGTTTDSGPLSPIEEPGQSTVEPGTFALLIVRGPAAGDRIELVGEEMMAGRSPDAEIFLDDITVSRQHARFEYESAAWRLVDCRSLNGTYVNRSRVDTVKLSHGDEIQIGKYRFHFLAGPGGDE
jgi:pSer/pThr/pTyr-binding forkhead associated (FHA) protein